MGACGFLVSLGRTMSKSRKFLTRRELKYWFQPITDFIKNALAGEVDSVQGYPITYIATRKVYARMDTTLEGFRESVERMLPDFDFAIFHEIEKRLANGILLEEKHLRSLHMAMLSLENKLVRIPALKIMDAVRTQMISIEMRMALRGEPTVNKVIDRKAA